MISTRDLFNENIFGEITNTKFLDVVGTVYPKKCYEFFVSNSIAEAFDKSTRKMTL